MVFFFFFGLLLLDKLLLKFENNEGASSSTQSSELFIFGLRLGNGLKSLFFMLNFALYFFMNYFDSVYGTSNVLSIKVELER